ncbi:MAG: cyclic lactone autoinducer peptide [Acetobacter sp.]|nr:cyclic lactone autoinducer peptide [Bacteroides sp.]MCM1341798.1 cyclic lactone autoinducer peptide [Acetobacter sp.]MCM1433140.1 cyclic lactone autoinducer peptide [Clostridiales bacterium]
MKSQKKIFTKVMKTVVEKSLVREANSTSCMIYYQPKAPVSLKKFSKVENDK